MCGVAGVFAPTASAKWKAKIFRRLLLEAQSRGRDATGYAYVENGEMVVVKDGTSASEFVNKNTDFLDLMTRAEKEGVFPNLIMGHARGATKGATTGPEDNDNNHPFYAEDTGIAMMHNGLISNDDDWRDTAGKAKGLIVKPKSHVDSEVMLRAIETFYVRHKDDTDRGLTEAIEDACYCVAGTYVLGVMKHDEPDTIWLVRHKNPLYLAWVPSKKAILFASTEEMLKAALTSEKIIMDFFIEESQTPAIINSLREDYMLKISYIGNDNFDMDVTLLDCATGPGRMTSTSTETEGGASHVDGYPY